MTKKNLFVLQIGNYFPKLCKITIPNLKSYADRIGADFRLITERKFLDFPVSYEKLQIFNLGKDSDWNILVDADFLINPRFWDVTEIVPQNHVGVFLGYKADTVFKELDEYFLRDKRNQGLASNFVVTHQTCHDLWTPLDILFEDAIKFVPRSHIIDEYCISRNLAQFGLKLTGLVPQAESSDLVVHLDATTQDGDEKVLVRSANSILNHWKTTLTHQYGCLGL